MMSYDDVQKGIISAISNPDTMETTIQPVLEGLKADYEGFNSLSEELEKANARIRDLQDTNHKLFLAQTGNAQDEPDDTEKPTGVGVFDEFKNLVEDFDTKKA